MRTHMNSQQQTLQFNDTLGLVKSWCNDLPVHTAAAAKCLVLLNNLTWAVGSKITLYRRVFLLSLWCSLEIRTDHPCWHSVLTLHEMHTIMQIVLKAIKPCSSLRTPPPPHSCTPLFGCGENPQFWMAAKAGLCSRRAFVIRDAPGTEASWGNISKVGAGWNESSLTELYLFYQPLCVDVSAPSSLPDCEGR